MMKGFSVIICCYNSSKRLPQTLKHLAEQKVPENINWEVIVVDNASTDDTGDVALKIWNESGGNIEFKVVCESTPGLINARMKGVAESKYEYIIFCDDDNWLDENYVQTAFEIMKSNPKIGALGGQSEAVSDVDFPEWFDDYKSGYAVGKQAEQSGDVSSRMYLWGAGLVTRKSLMERVFDPEFPMLLSGRNGEQLMAGDDSEICARILLLNFKLYYSEKLFFKHFISSDRLGWEYRKRMYMGFEISYQILRVYFEFISYLSFRKLHVLKLILSSVFRLIVYREKEKLKYIGFVTGCQLFFREQTSYDVYKYYIYNKSG